MKLEASETRNNTARAISSACAEVIIQAARHWIPVGVLSMAMGGASSPISVSGTLVTHNAEVLGGIVLAQITNPGTPVTYAINYNL